MPSEYWGNQGVKPGDKRIITRAELEKKSMKELRDFVKKHDLNASDNNKKELIDEIMEEI